MSRSFLLFLIISSSCAFNVNGLQSDGGSPPGGDGSATDGSAGDGPAGVDTGGDLNLTPSHVDPSYLHPGAPSLSGVTGIDTSALTIAVNGGPYVAPPDGVGLVRDPVHGYAVLS